MRLTFSHPVEGEAKERITEEKRIIRDIDVLLSRTIVKVKEEKGNQWKH